MRPIDENGKITSSYLERLEDEAIDGIAIEPDDALLVFDRLRELESLWKNADTAAKQPS